MESHWIHLLHLWMGLMLEIVNKLNDISVEFLSHFALFVYFFY